MTLQDFRTFYLYNDWANDRLLKMLYEAFGEETNLRESTDPRCRAIQEAAVHIVSAQSVWRQRWQGHSPDAMLDPEEYPTPLAIRMAFGAERARFWGYFETLKTEEALLWVCDFKNTRGEAHSRPLWQMLQHVITHGGYHRGQITGRLLDMGFDALIISTDLISYHYENS
jgi:uncharacterized damage-inducible protein DinB